MWLFGLLLLAFVSPRSTQQLDCVEETLKCSQFLPTPFHGSLLLPPSELDSMCKQQEKFFKCLDNIVDSGISCGIGLPDQVMRFRETIEDLCTDTSAWRKKYLELAPCINQQSTEFCSSPEFFSKLGLDGIHDKCSLGEESINCVAATLAMNCGIEAGKLFHHFLGVYRNVSGNCYTTGLETVSFEVQEVADDKNEGAYVYTSVSKRISEQDESAEDSVVEDVPEEKYWVSDPVDNLESVTEHPATHGPVGNIPEFDSLEAFAQRTDIDWTVAVRFYGNTSIAFYHRAPLELGELVFCYKTVLNAKTKFACEATWRTKTPTCLEGKKGVRNPDVPIVPEEVDPELGAKLYAMYPYAYNFRPLEEVYDKVYKRFLEGRVGPVVYLSNIADQSMWSRRYRSVTHFEPLARGFYKSMYSENWKHTVADTKSDSLATESEFLTQEWDSGSTIHENFISTSEEKPIDLVRSYVMSVTTLMPPKELERRMGEDWESDMFEGMDMEKVFGTKRLSEEQEKLWRLLLTDTSQLATKENLLRRKYWISPATIIEYFDVPENTIFNSLTCGRINECHPNATFIWKCILGTEDQQKTEGAESQIHRRIPRYKEHHIDADVFSPVQKSFDKLENVKPIVRFAESRQQNLGVPVTEEELDYASFLLDGFPLKAREAELETEPVQVLLAQPDNLPVLNSQYRETEAAYQTFDVELPALMSDENPTSNDIDISEGLRQKLAYFASLNDMEDMIVGGFDNM